MPLSPKASRILARIQTLTREAQPEVQAVVAMSTFNDNEQAIFDRIRNVAMPRQREIAAQVSALLELQRDQTEEAVKNAEISYLSVPT